LEARHRDAATGDGGSGVQGRVGRGHHGECTPAFREGLVGLARVEERRGQRGGDPGYESPILQNRYRTRIRYGSIRRYVPIWPDTCIEKYREIMI